MARDWSIFTKGRLFRQRALLKDPFAAFSAPWFARKLGCQAVVTVRHPAAFASSLKWLKWDFDFNDLLAQPLLMQDWLEPFRYDIEKSLHEGAGIIVRASLLWRIVYRVMMDYQQEFSDFRVVRHEDLSLDPIQGFGALYESLGLSFSDRARKVILESSSADNPKQLAKGKVHQVRLDSRANLDNWKRRLEKEEIRRIRQITEGVAEIYYPDQSWD
jgi:hypothetical protein